MSRKLLLFSILLFNLSMLRAQDQPVDVFGKDMPQEANKEFQFLAYFTTQGVTSNFYPENIFMQGQVVGRLFGDNTTRTSDSLVNGYFEQRILPFFIYQPHLFNGKAILRASFEIDWTWGDASYGAGGNLGSALSADYVNIQTQNIELELIPKTGWAINIGLQRLYDTPYNPYRTFVDKMLQTGYRLSYWGTDGVGISVRHDRDFSRLKAGIYELYENNVQENDDVILGELSYEKDLTPLWKLGGSLYYINDRASGEGGVSIYSQGLNSKLTGYNGVFRFNFGSNDYKADVIWTGVHFSRNSDMMMDRLIVSGFVNGNFGRALVQGSDDTWSTGADIAGFAANSRIAYRYGQTTNDLVSLEGIFTSGDKNALSDGKYNGVVTGNTWGTPAGLLIGTGAYLLFPHGNVVNRYMAAVTDLSNMGYGLSALVFNARHDFIPNRFGGKIGAAKGFSNVAPAGGGKDIGTELNAAIEYTFGPYMSLGVHAAYMWLGNFYDSNDASYGYDVNGSYTDVRPVNPWTAFISFKWLMF